MSRMPIHIQGVGAVSPAGWGTNALVDAIDRNLPLPTESLSRPGVEKPLGVRRVPALPQRETKQPPLPHPPGENLRSLFGHPRMRRTSPISKFALAAAVEAVGNDARRISAGEIRLGIVTTVMAGCVNYCSRFYGETL